MSNILCIGAGYVGGPTMAMFAKYVPFLYLFIEICFTEPFNSAIVSTKRSWVIGLGDSIPSWARDIDCASALPTTMGISLLLSNSFRITI